MFKFIVLFSVVAIAAASPSLLHTPITSTLGLSTPLLTARAPVVSHVVGASVLPTTSLLSSRALLPSTSLLTSAPLLRSAPLSYATGFSSSIVAPSFVGRAW